MVARHFELTSADDAMTQKKKLIEKLYYDFGITFSVRTTYIEGEYP